jgi:RecA/RadA recombinase
LVCAENSVYSFYPPQAWIHAFNSFWNTDMDETRLVLVLNKAGKWEDKTGEVAACIADPTSGQVRISYKINPKHEYSYRQERVRLLAATAALNPVEVQLRVGGQLLSGADSIFKFPDFYLVMARGARTLYAAADVREERDVAADPARGAVLDYFRAVAELVSVKNDEDQSILTGQYKYLSRVPDASVLAAYLIPGSPLAESDLPGPLIYPFGTNASQKAAVENTFRSQVTIVQGPPGTGKTQTILNMVANAIRFGHTVAVVSNNNAATRNVADKLEESGLGFLLAALGRRANKAAFVAAQSGYPARVSQAVRRPEEIARLDARIASLATILDRLIQANNDRAMLAAQVAQTSAEAELHRRIEGSSPPPDMGVMLDRWTASDLLELLIECEEIGPDARTGLLSWFRNIYLHGLSGPKVRRQLLRAGPVALRSLYYDKHQTELQAQLAALEGFLAENNFQAIQQEMEKVSWELLLASIAERFRGRDTRPIFTEPELWSRYASFLEEYPVVLSTTHSLKTSLSPDCLYDLVIVDEASQVDVTTGVLALSCAKRAVIVGDEKQLPNVINRVVPQ